MSLEGQRLGLYRVGRELGRGGMGTVYRATSEESGPAGPTGSAVALKVFHEHLLEEGSAFERFRREAEVGKQIRHPHVVRTFDVGESRVADRPVHYMVMELIEGQTLAQLLTELGTVPEHLRYPIADQVLDALQAIHDQGIVHRDIKPQNIVITPDYRVLLMDLGVARLQKAGHTLTEAGEFVGSLMYAAPEQFRRDDEGIGARADLYAFGLVLHELTTGRCPFEVDDLPNFLRQKLNAEVAAPRATRSDVGAFWNEVVLAATRSKPTERFASAAEMRRVLQEGEAGVWWRGRTARVARPAADRALQRLRLDREVPLVGRADAWERLGGIWERAARGGVLLLGGPSGVGKSRLLYDFLEQVASADGPSVAAGRGVGAGGRSYQPFVELLLDLLAPDATDPAERRAAIAARLTPLLADTPGVVFQVVDFLLGGIQPGVEGAASKDALLVACSRILQRLAAERPLIVVVEDLHLAGAESVELFGHVARGVAGHPLLLVGVYSEDEIEEGSALHALVSAQTLGTVERLSLGPLDAASTEELVRAVVQTETSTRALAHPLHERSDGNALLVLEMLAHLKSEKVLVPGREGLELTRPLDPTAVPTSVRGLVGLKLSRLDDEQRELLEAAAVLGYEFEAPLLAAVLGQNRLQVFKRLAEFERKHRLFVGSGKHAFRFASRQLYEAVYGAIPGSLRSEYHALVADTIAAGLRAEGKEPAGATAYALLRHLLHAERAEEAAPFLQSALDHVAASLHPSTAAPFLDKVASAFANAAPDKRLAIALRQWTCYEFLARRADQMRVIAVAQELADRLGEPGPRARVHANRAGSYWYAGDYEGAATEARLGLDLARAAGDRKGEATCRHTLGALAYRRGALEQASTELGEALRIRREIGDRRGEASTLQALGLVMAEIGQEDRVLPTMEQALAIWREVGERRGESSVLMNIGNHLLESAQCEEGRRYFVQAIAGQRETGALLSEAMALANLGNAEEIIGRIDAARTAWQQALRLFVDLGDPNGEIAVRTMLGAALGAYGEHVEARKQLEASIEIAARKGVRPKLLVAHREMGRLLHAQGRRAEGWQHLEKALALEDDVKSVSSRVLTLSAMGNAALAEGDAQRAVRLLGEALPAARTGTRGTAVLVLCRLARAHGAAGRPGEAAALAREALERLEAAGRVAPTVGPEIYGTLAEFAEGPRRQELLERARAIADERARHIRDATHREHFLTQGWLSTRLRTLNDRS